MKLEGGWLSNISLPTNDRTAGSITIYNVGTYPVTAGTLYERDKTPDTVRVFELLRGAFDKKGREGGSWAPLTGRNATERSPYKFNAQGKADLIAAFELAREILFGVQALVKDPEIANDPDPKSKPKSNAPSPTTTTSPTTGGGDKTTSEDGGWHLPNVGRWGKLAGLAALGGAAAWLWGRR